MTAIKSVVKNEGEFVGVFRGNVIRVLCSYAAVDVPMEYGEQIDALHKQMMLLIQENEIRAEFSAAGSRYE